MDKIKLGKNILLFHSINFVKYLFTNFTIFTALLSTKRHLHPGILFFEGIITLLVSTILILVLVIRFEPSTLRKVHGAYMSLISFLIILVFHTTVITIVDRSISIFILGNVKNESLLTEKIEQNFIDRFTGDAIRKRISEQIEIGNFELTDGKPVITNRGSIMFDVFQMISLIYNTDQSILDYRKHE